MKLVKGLVTISSTLLLLTACNSNEPEEPISEDATESTAEVENEVAPEENDEETESVEVDKGLMSSEITLPAELAEDFDIEDSELDDKNVTRNDDGSVTLKLSRAEHQEFLNEMKETVTSSIDSLTTDETFPSFKEIEYNDNFSELTVVVDREEFESGLDGFGLLTLAIPTLYYQVFEGVDSEDLSVTVELEDEKTGEVYDTIIYPDDLEGLGEED